VQREAALRAAIAVLETPVRRERANEMAAISTS
jgi:hypothetical protein